MKQNRTIKDILCLKNENHKLFMLATDLVKKKTYLKTE